MAFYQSIRKNIEMSSLGTFTVNIHANIIVYNTCK